MLKIGHRGASGIAPENTRAAFKKAIELGADMVELDIQLTKDKELIVFHDDNLKRITGVNVKVKDLTLHQLKQFDIGSWFEEKFKEERILTLQELIQLIKGRLKLNIEIKVMREEYNYLIKKLTKILDKENFNQEAIISSFNHQLLRKIKDYNSTLKTAILIASLPIRPLELIKWANADGVHPHYLTVTKELITIVKQEGLFINTWTVNDQEEIKRLKDLGIDGIITDYPQLAF